MLPRTKIKLFMDGADLAAMTRARAEGLVSGFTTNPTLMRGAGVAAAHARIRLSQAAAIASAGARLMLDVAR